jgi:ClpP class serine protease
LSRAIDWIYSHRWAILPEMLTTIIDIATRDRAVEEAISKRDNEPLPNTRRAEIRDGVAIIPVTGPIFPRANLFTSISGATSIQTLAKDFTEALANKDVAAIVLNIDSPGGEVTGVSEFADMVYDGRGTKPITAYVYGLGASAAYWIASAASSIVLADTAEVGSIGVVSAWTDTREKDKRGGVQTIEIVSSHSPRKRPDPATDAGRAQILKIVDDLAATFISKVARNRGVSSRYVEKYFGQGDVMVGGAAVDVGMADAVGRFEGVVESFVVKQKPLFQLFAGEGEGTMNIALLKEKHPDVYAACVEEGRAAGVVEGKAAGLVEGKAAGIEEGRTAGAAAERDRIKAIESIKVPGSDAVIAAEKFNPSATKESVGMKILDAQAAALSNAEAASAASGAALAAKLAQAGTPVPQDASAEQQANDATIDAAVKKANAGRR